MTNDYMTTWLLLGGRGAPQLANNKHFFYLTGVYRYIPLI